VTTRGTLGVAEQRAHAGRHVEGHACLARRLVLDGLALDVAAGVVRPDLVEGHLAGDAVDGNGQGGDAALGDAEAEVGELGLALGGPVAAGDGHLQADAGGDQHGVVLGQEDLARPLLVLVGGPGGRAHSASFAEGLLAISMWTLTLPCSIVGGLVTG
jgi:hypothetical protein